VYLARPKLGDRPAPRLVVKRLLACTRGESDFQVLEREAALHQAVQHPNVVTVYGAGMVDGEPYIAMEYVEGVDLYRLLRRAELERRRVPPPLAVYVTRLVANALESVHGATDAAGAPLNIVHRDISPSNVYLSLEGDVKVGDFGIARASTTRRLPAPGGLKGKLGYVAPEQVAGEAFDHRADLFALANMLGEILIGDRVFPGTGELAVLLAIRDADLDQLRRLGQDLPPELMRICEKGLARRPEDRFASAREFAAALAPHELPSAEALRATLADWVRWARDDGNLARQIEGRVRDSVERMRAVRLAHTTEGSFAPVALPESSSSSSAPPGTTARLKRRGASAEEQISFPKLLEMVATGELSARDRVALAGAEFRRVSDIEELARHLAPQPSSATVRLHTPGVPDYRAMLGEQSLASVLVHMRRHGETGALFLTRQEGEQQRRKEIYLRDGRLHHIAASDRDELLGEYLVRRGALDRDALNMALHSIGERGGRLGDTLIGLGLVDAMDVFRAIRDQGRDRVAALFGWARGTVSFYRGPTPGRVEFPLDLDLTSPIMAGVIVASHGNPRSLLPEPNARVVPGTRAEAAQEDAERGTAPMSLQAIPRLLGSRPSVERLLASLMDSQLGRGVRRIGEKEACAAVVTAVELGWAAFESASFEPAPFDGGL
jgi:serine/threonine-protein kinase